MARLVMMVLLCAFGCSRASDEAKAKRAPLSPPPPHAAQPVPAELSIALEIDGKAGPAIDGKQLGALEPDFADADRRAWRLTRVLGETFAKPEAMVEAVDARGGAVVMYRPKNDMAPQPALMLTRRGELAAMVVEAADPFPAFHGQGGRLRRPGDATPRVLPVVRAAGLDPGARGQGAVVSQLHREAVGKGTVTYARLGVQVVRGEYVLWRTTGGTGGDDEFRTWSWSLDERALEVIDEDDKDCDLPVDATIMARLQGGKPMAFKWDGAVWKGTAAIHEVHVVGAVSADFDISIDTAARLARVVCTKSSLVAP